MKTKLFLTHHDSADFSSSPCGCILERRKDGEGANFLMCQTHAAAPQMLDLIKAALPMFSRTMLYNGKPMQEAAFNLIAKAEGIS